MTCKTGFEERRQGKDLSVAVSTNPQCHTTRIELEGRFNACAKGVGSLPGSVPLFFFLQQLQNRHNLFRRGWRVETVGGKWSRSLLADWAFASRLCRMRAIVGEDLITLRLLSAGFQRMRTGNPMQRFDVDESVLVGLVGMCIRCGKPRPSSDLKETRRKLGCNDDVHTNIVVG